jgi:hypothetical protein
MGGVVIRRKNFSWRPVPAGQFPPGLHRPAVFQQKLALLANVINRCIHPVYGYFAKSYPLDWWKHMKVRAVLGEFEIKMRTWEGKVAKYRMKLRGGYLVAKES